MAFVVRPGAGRPPKDDLSAWTVTDDWPERIPVTTAEVDVFDPWVDAAEAQHEYGLTPIESPEQGVYDAIVLAVGHDEFRTLGGQGVRAFGKPQASIVYDVKYVLPRDWVDGRL